jgi:hypothetical protein
MPQRFTLILSLSKDAPCLCKPKRTIATVTYSR